jgi:cellulose synthase/poly-beta-1,6-N-acetylglucosamine synthase-like glycosyltransferase
MDRYEQVCSALNMGSQPVMGRGNTNVFYVPTCNMLVRKAAYTQTGGLDERLRLGEDVDLCWRLMAAGHHLLYQPKGIVLHKHRNNLWSGLRRRFDYGTSEAVLYGRFPKIKKQFPWQPGGFAIILAGVAALATHSWFWLMLLTGLPVLETGCKKMQLGRKLGIRMPVIEILGSVLKSHFQLIYYLAFYLVRYHLLLLVALAVVYPDMRWLCLAVLLCPVLVTYLKKRPKLSFPVFGFFYLAEHAFYQWGAFLGCIRQKSFRLYGLSFRYAGFLHRPKGSAKGRSVVVNQPSKGAVGG